MSVFYRLHQDQSVGTKRSGKWYARMVPTSCINDHAAQLYREEGRYPRRAGRAGGDHARPDAGFEAREAGRLRLVQDRHQLEGCPLGEGVHRSRQHQGHAHRVHPRALYRRCWQPREAVPAGSEVRRAA